MYGDCFAPQHPPLAQVSASEATAQGMHLSEFGSPTGFSRKGLAQHRDRPHAEV